MPINYRKSPSPSRANSYSASDTFSSTDQNNVADNPQPAAQAQPPPQEKIIDLNSADFHSMDDTQIRDLAVMKSHKLYI